MVICVNCPKPEYGGLGMYNGGQKVRKCTENGRPRLRRLNEITKDMINWYELVQPWI